jgi:hypothetical protein
MARISLGRRDLTSGKVSAQLFIRCFMANQRGTFAKRQREMDLKDKARQKNERRAQKKDENRPNKGPQIDWAQPRGVLPDAPAPATTPPSTDSLVPKDDAPTPDTNDD